MWWMGDPFLGVRLKLKGAGVSWDSAQKLVHLVDVPDSWGGEIASVRPYALNNATNQTTFRGGVNVSSATDGVVTLSAFGGRRNLAEHQTLTFDFELIITPAQPFSPKDHFSLRYAQVGADLPLDTAGIQKMVQTETRAGERSTVYTRRIPYSESWSESWTLLVYTQPCRRQHDQYPPSR
jgi:hypothetical protein